MEISLSSLVACCSGTHTKRVICHAALIPPEATSEKKKKKERKEKKKLEGSDKGGKKIVEGQKHYRPTHCVSSPALLDSHITLTCRRGAERGWVRVLLLLLLRLLLLSSGRGIASTFSKEIYTFLQVRGNFIKMCFFFCFGLFVRQGAQLGCEMLLRCSVTHLKWLFHLQEL